MSLYDLQKQVHEFTKQFEPQYWPPFEILAHLQQEVGELAREVGHKFGNEKKKAGEESADLGGELIDVFFPLLCLANSQGIDLDQAWKKHLDKLWVRDKDRFEKKQENPE